jgi:hypothetical protein
MKLIKKQPSTSYVIKATASKSLKGQAYPGGNPKGDVANHGDFIRLYSRSMAVTSNHKVGSITQVSFCTTSRERVWSPYPVEIEPMGLEKHSQLRERHPSCIVEEDAHNRRSWNAAYLLRK